MVNQKNTASMHDLLDTLYQKTTPGRWYTHDNAYLIAEGHGPLLQLYDHNQDMEEDDIPLSCEERYEAIFTQGADVQWTAQLHNAWPDLIAELRQLRIERNHYHEYLQDIIDEGCGAETLVLLAQEALDRADAGDWVSRESEAWMRRRSAQKGESDA